MNDPGKRTMHPARPIGRPTGPAPPPPPGPRHTLRGIVTWDEYIKSLIDLGKYRSEGV